MTDEAAPSDRPLTLKQAKFVEEYLRNGGNGTAAYRAVYATDGMSESAINAEAAKMKRHPRVGPLISHLVRKADLAMGKAIEKAAARRGEIMGDAGALTKAGMIETLTRTFKEAAVERHWSGVGRLAELLARLQGWVVEPTRNVRVIRSMSDLSEAELSVLAGEDGAGDGAVKH